MLSKPSPRPPNPAMGTSAPSSSTGSTRTRTAATPGRRSSWPRPSRPPTVGPGCKLNGGTWLSYYDDKVVDGPAGLDIDHMVPLAEAWDSGASQWTAARRQAYANDLAAERSLVAVTAKTNRQKADQDPADWMPPSTDARCTYLSDWVGTKLRWSLTVDRRERDTLRDLAASCHNTDVEYERA